MNRFQAAEAPGSAANACMAVARRAANKGDYESALAYLERARRLLAENTRPEYEVLSRGLE